MLHNFWFLTFWVTGFSKSFHSFRTLVMWLKRVSGHGDMGKDDVPELNPSLLMAECTKHTVWFSSPSPVCSNWCLLWAVLRRYDHWYPEDSHTILNSLNIIESAYAMVEWCALRNRGRRMRQWLADFNARICLDRHRRHRRHAVCQFKSTSFPRTPSTDRGH